MKPNARVIAALIKDEDRFLICQRPVDKQRALLWEFVGGKVEPNESDEEALVRECREELGIEVKPLSVFYKLKHEYEDIDIDLIVYDCEIVEGIPKLLEHNDLSWIKTDQIDDYEFCPADYEILEQLKERF